MGYVAYRVNGNKLIVLSDDMFNDLLQNYPWLENYYIPSNVDTNWFPAWIGSGFMPTFYINGGVASRSVIEQAWREGRLPDPAIYCRLTHRVLGNPRLVIGMEQVILGECVPTQPSPPSPPQPPEEPSPPPEQPPPETPPEEAPMGFSIGGVLTMGVGIGFILFPLLMRRRREAY